MRRIFSIFLIGVMGANLVVSPPLSAQPPSCPNALEILSQWIEPRTDTKLDDSATINPLGAAWQIVRSDHGVFAAFYGDAWRSALGITDVRKRNQAQTDVIQEYLLRWRDGPVGFTGAISDHYPGFFDLIRLDSTISPLSVLLAARTLQPSIGSNKNSIPNGRPFPTLILDVSFWRALGGIDPETLKNFRPNLSGSTENGAVHSEIAFEILTRARRSLSFPTARSFMTLPSILSVIGPVSHIALPNQCVISATLPDLYSHPLPDNYGVLRTKLAQIFSELGVGHEWTFNSTSGHFERSRTVESGSPATTESFVLADAALVNRDTDPAVVVVSNSSRKIIPLLEFAKRPPEEQERIGIVVDLQYTDSTLLKIRIDWPELKARFKLLGPPDEQLKERLAR